MNVNNFGCFNSEVWGSVSDVVSAIFAVVATIGLYLTLGKQIKINWQSLETSRIAIRPYFELKDGSKGFIKLTCKNANALNFKILKIEPILSSDIKQQYIFKEEILDTKIDLDLKTIQGLTPIDNILLTLYFMDEIRREYKQNIIKTDDRPIISHPILIKR